MAKFSALLDACTLVPVSLADTFLSLAEAGLYRPLWSDRILEEVSLAVGRIHPELPPEAVERRIAVMQDFFDDANVTSWEVLESVVALPDPDDAHVLAAAIQGRADVIVTFNVKDFPRDELQRFGIDVQTPDEFLLNQLDLDPDEVLACLARQAGALKSPPVQLRELLDGLEKLKIQGFTSVARKLLWRVQ
ncbi:MULTISPECIES: putative toxin-antitoxin system toxin component, PIN family [Corynebacterium]|uniref:PIN domain-containing protein n=1 Tax=Corynebacterium TaxID=1716 RepID=UPI0016435D7F|nr:MULTISPECIES: PIN domain-containing protein [Corynebacterium]MCQ9676979.1 PIN domain-containing protein [Corynebacterium sp. BF-R-2]